MATRQRQRTERTRLAFLTAARDLLLEQGYTSTSVADIVRRGGRAHGTFYLYFDNKHDVFAALLTQLATRATAATETPIGPPPDGGTTTRDIVAHAVAELVRVVDAHADLWRLIEEVSAVEPGAIAVRLQVRQALETWLANALTTGLDRADLEHVDVASLAELVTGSILWLARPGRSAAALDVADAGVDIVTDVLIRATARPTPP